MNGLLKKLGGNIKRFETAFDRQLYPGLGLARGPGGFQHERDILAITVNRWSHRYASFSNSLFDDADESEALMNVARKPVGHVSIANSDAAWEGAGPLPHLDLHNV